MTADLREPGFLRLFHFLTPLPTLTFHRREIVEQETHGAGEDAFDLLHFVAGIDEVFECGDDG